MNIDHRSEPREDFFPDIPAIPLDPLAQIGKDVKEGFDYARRCLVQSNRLRRRIVRLEQAIADLKSRQEYVEDLLIQGGRNAQ